MKNLYYYVLRNKHKANITEITSLKKIVGALLQYYAFPTLLFLALLCYLNTRDYPCIHHSHRCLTTASCASSDVAL